MNDIVKSLVASFDEATAKKGSRNTLVLVGDPNSEYLRLIEKRAEKLGLMTTRATKEGLYSLSGKRPIFVLDNACKNETLREKALEVLAGTNDIDCMVSAGLSSCAEACLRIIKATRFIGTSATVCGRGHANKGLIEALGNMDFSPSLLHHKSSEGARLRAACFSSVLVNASDKMEWAVWPMTDTVVLDVCGSLRMAADRFRVYYSPSDIGAFNISILLHRFVEV